ncbi:hypothetical protein [Streptomyces sp. NPDC001401]|uniref:hypothetical protein n=1 Tax=Streptomyces sp. NPDC001401 TaxID=3364570 RepID=UPI00368D9F1F
MSVNGYPAVEGELELEEELESELEFETEREWEGELEGEWEAEGEYGPAWEGEGGGSGREFDFETEAEAEAEEESEGFVNPVRRIYPDAELMAHLGRAASTAESEGEAEAFIGALVPLAAKLIPRAAQLVSRVAPQLIQGATRVTRQLRRDPATRKLVEAVPVILQRTAQSIADQVENGRPLSGDMALRTLGRMTTRVLGTPAARNRARHAVRVFDERRHSRIRRDSARGTVAPSNSRSTNHGHRCVCY